MQILAQFLSSGFMPHGFCYLWDPPIVWLHVISDSLIGLSYYCIPLGLIYFLAKRPDIHLHWILWLFGIFILGCGTTHLMEVWTVWHGSYLLSGVIKALTAGASVITAIALIPLVPKAVALPSYAQLEQINQQAQEQIAERKSVESKFRELAGRLEERVAERTAELEEIRHALQESQARLAGIIASAMDAIITVDEDQRIVLFNTAAEKMFLCPAAEATGQPVERFIPQRFREKHREHIRRFGESGVNSRNACPLAQRSGLRGDGQEFPVEASISQTAAGGRKLFTVIIRDVTEKQRAEASRLHLAAIVESTDSAVLSKDLTGIVTSWNKGAELLYGYRRDEIVGQHVNLIIPQELRGEEDEILRQIAEGRMVRRAEALRQHKDGRLIYVSLVISPVRDPSGQIAGASTIAHDITERKWAEEALQESEERLRLFIRHAPAALAMFDRDMRYLQVSRRWLADYGLGDRDMRGLSHYEVFPNLPERWKEIHRRGLAGEVLQQDDDRFDRPDGSVQWLRWEIRPWYEMKGEIGGIVIFAEDITASKVAEATLREREERIGTLLDSTAEAILGSDLEGNCTFCNPSALRLLGYQDSAEVLGRNLHATIHHTSSDGRRLATEDCGISRAMRSGQACHADDEVFWRKDGISFAAECWSHPCFDKDQLIGSVVTFLDVSERRRAEAALRESEERFQAMANGIPQLAWMAAADGSIFWYNQRWYEYTGATLEQMQGWGWQSVHDPQFLPSVMQRWKASLAEGHPFDMEFPLRGRDGSFRTFLTRVQPVRDAEGRVVRWFGTNTDISDLKAAEERLALQAEELSRQAEELRSSRAALEAQTLMLQSMLDNMEEGLVAANDQGQFLLWNSAAERILGGKAQNLPANEWSKVYGLYLPDGITHYPAERLPLVKALQGDAGKAEIQVIRPGSSESAWIEVSARPLRDARAQLCGGIATFRDITVQRAAEQEIRKLNDDLEQRVLQRTMELEIANQELESFTYSVSHDLRAPLRHIGAFSRLLVEEFGSQLEPEARHYLERITHGTRKMGQLVDELLNLARVGRQALTLQPAGLTPILQEALEVLKPEMEGRHIEWKIASLPRIDCDPPLIKQVFQNLLANALKYSRPRPCAVIEVGTIKENDELTIFVRDNGVGFSMKYADKLFGVFQRLHRDEDFEGTGVGLATVKRIVQKHGGRVWAEGEPDRGATFYFTLRPAVQAVKTMEVEPVGARA